MKKKVLIIISLFSFLICFSQKKKSSKIGNASIEELKMVRYENDSTANAVVLYEHANHYLDEKRDYNRTTDYYFRIKILKKAGFNKATIRIPSYGKEKVHHIKGITYNLNQGDRIKKTHLISKNIFTKKLNEKWKEITFTMPALKVGSIIEYVYSVTTPYSQMDDWLFQSDIPKVKSDFTASILGNWKYNIRVIGFLPLTTNQFNVDKNCVYIPGMGKGACALLAYGIENIPAFKEEKHMLSAKNFKSRLVFDLESYRHPSQGIEKYTKTWRDADKRLKNNFLDKQTSKKNYFKKQLPSTIFNSTSELNKAKAIFSFIKNHYTWNGDYWPSAKVRIKKAFTNKFGNIFDINLSLYNSLKAAEIETYLILTSTRDRAMPTKLHPVINEFNYLLVKIVIDNKEYYLDASKKQLPFGLVQFQALNGDGRLLNFKKGSVWEPIKLNNKAFKTIKVKLNLSEEETTASIKISTKSYYAVNKRARIQSKSEDEYIESFESNYPFLEVDTFKVENLNQVAKNLNETYTVTLEDVYRDGVFYINPFLITQHTRNPFKLKKRDYPVDFGYPSENTYIFSMQIPEGYKLKKELNNKTVILPNNGGKYLITTKIYNTTMTLFCKISINKSVYTSQEYHALKEFFNHIIKSQDVILEMVKE